MSKNPMSRPLPPEKASLKPSRQIGIVSQKFKPPHAYAVCNPMQMPLNPPSRLAAMSSPCLQLPQDSWAAAMAG